MLLSGEPAVRCCGFSLTCASCSIFVTIINFGGGSISHQDVGGTLLGFGFGFLALDIVQSAAKVFRVELQEQTWSALMMLPRNMNGVAWSKIGGCAIGWWPSLLMIMLGGLLVPNAVSSILDGIFDPDVFFVVLYVVMQVVLFLELTVLTSITLTWAAWPLAAPLSFFLVFLVQRTDADLPDLVQRERERHSGDLFPAERDQPGDRRGAVQQDRRETARQGVGRSLIDARASRGSQFGTVASSPSITDWIHRCSARSPLPLAACLSRRMASAADIESLSRVLKEPILDRGVMQVDMERFCLSRVPMMPEPTDRASWETFIRKARQETLEKVVFRGEAAKWRELPTKPEWLGEIDAGDYRIKRLRYEAVPGMWVCGLLYEPKKLSGKTPVAMHVNGHDRDGKAAKYKQIRCINFVKRGMLVLNLEWFNMGQLRSPEFDHYRLNELDLCGTSGVSCFYLAMSRGLDVLLAHAECRRLARLRLGALGRRLADDLYQLTR